MKEPADDTAIMAFLLDANSGRYDLAEVAHRFLGEPIVDGSPSLFDSTTSDEALIAEVALGRSTARAPTRRDHPSGTELRLRIDRTALVMVLD